MTIPELLVIVDESFQEAGMVLDVYKQLQTHPHEEPRNVNLSGGFTLAVFIVRHLIANHNEAEPVRMQLWRFQHALYHWEEIVGDLRGRVLNRLTEEERKGGV